MYMYLVPAYGRDYRTVKEVTKDWEGGKDFYLTNGREGTYCSIRDVARLKEQLKSDSIAIKYNKRTRTLMIGL